jgi:putative ABC transport system ATP-binding protein
MKDQILVELKEVTKIYGKGPNAVHALRGISLKVKQGEFVAIMGASGSGKSTSMNILGCLDVPSSGEYLFQNLPVTSLSPDQRALLRRYFIGFVFQSFNLLERASALENVELPLIYHRLPKPIRRDKALRMLEIVGLKDRIHHRPSELSGGEQQRVAIARAMVTEPLLLLADEPTGNLDSKSSHEIMDLFSRLNQERGVTIILVTHEEDIARYAKRRIVLSDGKIIKEEHVAGDP